MGCFDEYKPFIFMVVIQAIYAVTNLLSRASLLQGLNPRVYLFYRQVIATVVIFPIAAWQRPSIWTSLTLRSFAWIFITTLIGVTLNQNLYYEGMSLSSSSVASAMTNLIPAITFVMTAILKLEIVDIKNNRSIAKIVGTIICVGGAVTMALLKGPKLLNRRIGILPPTSTWATLTSNDNWLLGSLFLLGGCCCWSSWLILQVPVSRSYPDHLSMSAWLCFFSMLQAGVIAFFVEHDHEKWKLHSNIQIACCLYTGIVGSSVTFFLQAWCIKKRGPLFSALFNPLTTVMTAALAALFLHEEIFAGSVAGAVGVMIGLYIVLWGKSVEYVDINPEGKLQNEDAPTLKPDSVVDYVKVDLEEPLLSNKSCDAKP
ncbi:hypothetical protein MLD38_014922 [Melastoma candidum]|uniref:Uncharacterized protein n=1 Tax=Melastoma candidum TaxID=119954 RepID=A0ACB9RDZ0_9MYRT|nr:hypothetical protein MLD38_014922 [Melastoma candidum]